jgi:endonuclease/exonuclease/phosphatase family metal-dependent hydrolase
MALPATDSGIKRSTLRRRFQALVTLALILLLGPFVVSRACSPWQTVSVHRGSAVEKQVRGEDSLRIATFNIAHGRALAESNWGTNQTDRLSQLERIAEQLRRVDADVVVLNEVDFDCSWSYGLNQAEYLAEKAGYAHRVEQRNLDFRVLLWKWRFGNAVLSKAPVSSASVVSIPAYATWEQWLAGSKRSVACDIRWGNDQVRVVAAHLEPRGEGVRVSSAQALVEMAKDADYPVIIAGDLNSTPPGFPGSRSDAQGRNAIAALDQSGHFQRSPAEASPAASQFTFPSAQPRTVIDWILIPPTWHFEEYQVVSSDVSDHCLVYADISREPR